MTCLALLQEQSNGWARVAKAKKAQHTDDTLGFDPLTCRACAVPFFCVFCNAQRVLHGEKSLSLRHYKSWFH